MNIKRIEIKGFKSFPDKTILEFRDGITAIVGPNGCGKSNVFEAIRWVMGEQRVKSLRSKKMEDIVFNGSDARKPVGMAEVKLILSNADHKAPQSMADYDEIMVARRLFRDGQSNYELNGVQCRLSDILEFFMDTGVGKNSYAIIEQGRVDMIIASKPEDRRILIEEAAGISRYKLRKESTLKKLEQTEKNLLRINDIVVEVKRQCASLRRQAAKAEKYKSLNQQLKSAILMSQCDKCMKLEYKLSSLTQDYQIITKDIAELELQSALKASELERSKLLHLEKDQVRLNLMNNKHNLEMEMAAIKNKIEKDAIKKQHAISNISSYDKELQTIGAKQEVCSSERNSLQERSEILKSTLAQLSSQKDTLEKELAEYKSSQQKNVTIMDGYKDKLFSLLQNIASENNRKENARRSIQHIEIAKSKIEADWIINNSALEKATTDQIELHGKLEQIKEELERNLQKKDELQAAIDNLLEQSSSANEAIRTIDKDLAAKKAKLESMESIRNSYQDYSTDVQELMKKKNDFGKEIFLQPLAEFLNIPKELQKAVTTILGNRIESIVITSTQDALKCSIQDYIINKLVLLPRTPIITELPLPKHNDNSLLSKLIEKNSSEHISILAYLFATVLIVDSLDSAMISWENNAEAFDYVTLDGQLLTRAGEIILTSEKHNDSQVFGRKDEILQLQHSIEIMSLDYDAKLKSLMEIEARVQDESLLLEELILQLNELKTAEKQFMRDSEKLGTIIIDSERKLKILEKERSALNIDLHKNESELDNLISTISALEKKKQALEQQNIALKNKTHAARDKIVSKSKTLETINIEAAKFTEERKFVEMNLRNTNEELERFHRRQESLRINLRASEQEKDKLDREISNAQVNELATLDALKEVDNNLAKEISEVDLLTKLIETLSSEDKYLSGKSRELKEKAHNLDLQILETKEKLNAVIEAAIDQYQTDPHSIQLSGEPPSPEEIDSLKQKLELLGDVNPAAIAEYNSLLERLNYLTDQETDLNKAVESLYTTINMINKTTRERFKTAFAQINEKFQEIFPYLFRGGLAQLTLTDEDDPLESGVEITVRPPGKKVQNMDLLSGGEKALTAVALIFSIFLIKPSPFCLLDEVDAPLDDSNLNRFNSLLRELSDQTQFFIVTHNKRSMEEADSLYGITMEEPGVSRVVSVEFMC